jgi:threonine dehydrogenase-like Zn-dependent dehydrogenase
VYLTGYHAAHMGKVTPRTTVTVIGDGAVGLSAVLAAKQLGAERIILMGRHASRTDLGREFGATDVVAERGEEGIAQVLELTRGEGTHVVLEAVGLMPAYEMAYGVVRPGGVISRVGVPQYEAAPIGFGSLFGKNATLTGGPAPVRAYIDQALPEVLAGRINPGRVFDRTVSLDDVAEGYKLMDTREALKVLVTP